MIFGSTAAKYWYPDFRTPKDIDVLAQTGEFSEKHQTYWYGESSEYILKHNPYPDYVCPIFLYTIKAAHSKWDIFWDKTVADIMFFQRKGLKLHNELYSLLIKDFTKFHGKRWASLKNMNSKTFFEDKVTRKYVHDTVHEAVAFYDKPLYFEILKDPTSTNVACSEEKFNKLSEENKLKLVMEEVYVTALERYLIPNDFKFSTQKAYYDSLKKLMTTMSSGWFSKYIVENYQHLYHYKYDYVKTFQNNKNKLTLC